MSYREVRVFEVREALRLWLRGEGVRSIERLAQLDRKTVRRYVKAAEELGVVRDDGGDSQLTDELIGSVVEAVRPHRSDGHGEGWRLLVANHDQVKAWLDAGVTAEPAVPAPTATGFGRRPRPGAAGSSTPTNLPCGHGCPYQGCGVTWGPATPATIVAPKPALPRFPV